MRPTIRRRRERDASSAACQRCTENRLFCSGGHPCDRCREMKVECILRSRPSVAMTKVYAPEPTSAPEMRILGGLSGSLDGFNTNAQAVSEFPSEHDVHQVVPDKVWIYTSNAKQGSSTASIESSSTPTPVDVNSLQRLTSKISLDGVGKQETSIHHDPHIPQHFPGLPRHLRIVMERIPSLNLTGKLVMGTSILEASGGACDVFIANIANGYTIEGTRALKFAVKRIRTHINSDTDFSRYIAREIYIWSRLKHKNVLHFVGYIQDGEYPCLVSEWIDNGSLSTFLRNSNLTYPLSYNSFWRRMILGIVEGLSYLHKAGVIHSDIKPDNILVSSSGEPLLCDFGISRMLTKTQTFNTTTVTGARRGSTRWMAPELLDMDNPQLHSKESDVWAFGMTLYQLLSGKLPYSQHKHDVQVMLAILQCALPCIRLPSDREAGEDLALWDICKSCWKREREFRPVFPSIRQAMEDHFAQVY